MRRKSSVNERAMSLAQQHRRYSLMSQDNQGPLVDETEKKSTSEGEHNEV